MISFFRIPFTKKAHLLCLYSQICWKLKKLHFLKWWLMENLDTGNIYNLVYNVFPKIVLPLVWKCGKKGEGWLQERPVLFCIRFRVIELSFAIIFEGWMSWTWNFYWRCMANLIVIISSGHGLIVITNRHFIHAGPPSLEISLYI